jgi:hypothetical protein
MAAEDAFVNSVGAVKFTISDKMAGVAQKSMQLLGNTCN